MRVCARGVSPACPLALALGRALLVGRANGADRADGLLGVLVGARAGVVGGGGGVGSGSARPWRVAIG